MGKAYIKYFAALLLFGANGIVASYINLTSHEIVFLRTLIGSLLLISIFAVSKGKFNFHTQKHEALCLAISGIAMGASWMFLYEAYQQIGVSIASLAYYCGPVIVMALSPLLFHEKLTGNIIAGFLAVLCGVFLVNGQISQNGQNSWGLFCGGMSAIMYAFMVIFNKKAKDITGLENSMLQLLVSFLTVAVYVGVRQGFIIRIPSSDWPAILFLGLVNTGIGCYFYFSSINLLPVQTVAICGYLEPLSAVVLSVLILGEIMQPVQLAGAVLILGGAMLGEHTKVRSKRADK